MVPVETTEEDLLEILGLGLDVLGDEAEWSLCGLGKMEAEAEVAPIVLSGDVRESFLISVFEVED